MGLCIKFLAMATVRKRKHVQASRTLRERPPNAHTKTRGWWNHQNWTRTLSFLFLALIIGRSSLWLNTDRHFLSSTKPDGIASHRPHPVVTPLHTNQAKCSSLLTKSYQQHGDNVIFATNSTRSFTEVSKNGKPYFILHIGPSKTGTTTLQKDSAEFQDILDLDRYVYLGRYAPRSLRQPAKIGALFANDDCFRQVKAVVQRVGTDSGTSSWPECWINRTRTLNECYWARNSSIIISDEQLSYERHLTSMCNDPWYLPTLKSALFQNWNVLVVATYRRYAEWLLSVSKEVNQKVCHNPDRPEGQWNGSKCWSLWQLVNTYRSTTTGDAFSYMNLDATLPAWQRHGIPVQILDLHDGPSLTTSFYCTVIPNAQATCRHLLNRSESSLERRKNVQSVMTTAYNDIVYDASMGGLLYDTLRASQPHISRQEFVSDLAKRGASMGLKFSDLPLHCPNQFDLEILLQKSLKMERIIFGKDAPQREHLHVQTFWILVDDKKVFCSVDTNQLLNNKRTWAGVMEHLQELAGT